MKSQLKAPLLGIAGVLVGFAAVLIISTPNTATAPATEMAATTTPKTIAAKSTANVTVIDAVYPLFSTGITWSPKVSVTLPPRSNYNPTDKVIAGYQATSLPTASTKDIGATVEPLRNYYDNLLLKNGWKINVSYEADGPGGSLWGFTKGNQILILSYTSTFYDNEPNTPAQCPCTIVFTIIGGTLE